MTPQAVLTEVTCAVEVFLATAMLHKEQPARADFTIQEIVNRAARENITGEHRSGVNVHASQHCVANKVPNPARHRMLFATGKHTRRLLLPDDAVHPERTGKIFPDESEVPEPYLPILEWARHRYGKRPEPRHLENLLQARGIGAHGNEKIVASAKSATPEQWLSSLFELEGLGSEHWKDEDPDEFVRKLREGWE